MARTYPEKVRDHARREPARELRIMIAKRRDGYSHKMSMIATPAKEREALRALLHEADRALCDLDSAMRATRGR